MLLSRKRNNYNHLLIRNELLDEIKKWMNGRKYEHGGILGENEEGILTAFCPDVAPSRSTLFSYSPNVEYLESIINIEWAQKKIEFAGFVHSHMNNADVSPKDVSYIREIMKSNNRQNLICGIFNARKAQDKDVINWYNISNESVELLRIKKI